VHTALLSEPDLPLPALALVASGGHTAIYLLRAPLDSERLGTTRDDAAGEALDKGASLLGLPYPGGPSIERAAHGGDPHALELPRALLGPDSLDFSFSGLKTALLYHLRGAGAAGPLPALGPAQVRDLAAAYQEAVVDVLVQKLARAAERVPVKSLCIGGGVARNALLRARLAAEPRLAALRLLLPEPALCSDNGAMVAALGALQLRAGRVASIDLDAVATPQAGSKAKARP
jgi:N6-L-threonylcarbamoyladenine synthase